MPFTISASLSPTDLMRHGPLIAGAWQHPDPTKSEIVRGNFLVDTGAGGLAICESVARKLGLPVQRASEAHGFNGKVNLNQYAAKLHLPVKDDQRRDIMFMIPVDCQGVPGLSENHEAYGVNVVGIIGRLFLQFVRLEIDGTTGAINMHISDAVTRPSS